MYTAENKARKPSSTAKAKKQRQHQRKRKENLMTEKIAHNMLDEKSSI